MSNDLRRWLILAAVADFFVVRPIRKFVQAVFDARRGGTGSRPARFVQRPAHRPSDSAPAWGIGGAVLVASAAMVLVGVFAAPWAVVVAVGVASLWWCRPRR